MIRTHLSSDGTLQIWNDESGEMIVTTSRVKLSPERAAYLKEQEETQEAYNRKLMTEIMGRPAAEQVALFLGHKEAV